MMYQVYSDELYHHGVLGQKWGVRRYQNEDGSLTEAGIRRYRNKSKPRTKKGKIRDYARIGMEDAKKYQNWLVSDKDGKIRNYAKIGMESAKKYWNWLVE